MSEQLVESSFLRKLQFTPLSDLLWGKLSARLDWEGIVRSSSLPAELKELISRLTRRTRLWREERVDVVRELIAHFTDGLAAGETETTLVQAFGNEQIAARMIRRAKVRNRPLWWKIGRVVRWVLIAFFVFYGVLAIYFFSGRPSVRVDYLAILNEPKLATAESDRAWPLYRHASARGQYTLRRGHFSDPSSRQPNSSAGRHSNYRIRFDVNFFHSGWPGSANPGTGRGIVDRCPVADAGS
jgi:hypothetical protein